MTQPQVTVQERDGIAEVVLSKPERRNALSVAMIRELQAALDRIGAGSARALIVGSTGPVFCSGHDFADMAGRGLEEMRALLLACARMMQTLHEIPQPVVARVHGLATGAGCQLALTCDLVVASEEAAFETPGGRGGWFCTTPMVAVTRAVGAKRALEMLLTGDPVDARRALEWGMVNRVVPHASLETEARELAERASRGSVASKAIGKRAFYAQVALDEHQAYAHATEVMAASALLPDAQEGMRAFLEKRRPSFIGQRSDGKR
ncbi:MAG: enoyl-CoA hydratase/isomerase family protein [Planctomycetes bacterium]|nr:enoyl-CoA hydratase/isomerase family protein [Planctomycetota bacterium]